MKTFKTSTWIVPFVDVGTYWGPYEYDRLWGEDENRYQWEENGRSIVCDDYSHQKVGEAIVHSANIIFKKERLLYDYGVVEIKAVKFLSPKEYNFCDDGLDLEVTVTDDFLDRAERLIFADENREKVKKYMKDHWESDPYYRGFTSAMPATTMIELRSVFTDLRNRKDGEDLWEEHRLFGSVLALLMLVTDFLPSSDDEECWWDPLTDQILEDFEGSHSIGDFATILSREDYESKLGKHLFFDELDEYEKTINEQYRKYCESGVGEESQARASNWCHKVHQRVGNFRDDCRWKIGSQWPNIDVIEVDLDALKEGWEKAKNDEFAKYWIAGTGAA